LIIECLGVPEDIKPTVLTNGPMVVAWFWDGDGVLLVGEGEEWAVSEDCKKDNKWSWT
jgi:hypothetical protein